MHVKSHSSVVIHEIKKLARLLLAMYAIHHHLKSLESINHKTFI